MLLPLIYTLLIIIVGDVFILRCDASRYGLIYNASLILYDINSTMISGTCEQCLCLLFNNETYSSFNCDQNRTTCQMYFDGQLSRSFSISSNASSRVYFISLPVDVTSTTTTSTQTTTVTTTTSSSTTTTSTTTTTSFNPYTDLHWNQTASIVAGTGVKGTTPQQLDKPGAIYIDANDSLYICDHENDRIQKWPPGATSGITVAGDPATTNGTALPHPEYIAFDRYGAMYVTGHALFSVMRFLPGSYNGTMIAGDGSSGSKLHELNDPTDLIVDENRTLYVVDMKNHRVMRWPYNAPNGTILISSSDIDGVVAMLFVPGSSTQVYLSNESKHEIYIWTFKASTPDVILRAVNGTPSTFNHPKGLALDPYGNLYVADKDNDRIVMFVPNSTVGIPVVTAGSVSPVLVKPMDVAFDSKLNMYVSLEGNMVLKYQRT